MLTIQEAATKENVTKAAIYLAVRKGKLKSKKVKGRWMIKEKDLIEYIENKWNRNLSVYNGEPLFNPSKGELSVNSVADTLGVKPQAIYHRLRAGIINGFRKGSSWVIRKCDLNNYSYNKYHRTGLFSNKDLLNEKNELYAKIEAKYGE